MLTLADWKTRTHERLHALAATLRDMAPGTTYGFLSAATILPLIAAAQQGQAPYSEIFALLGGVGGNLIANQLQAWRDLSEAEIATDLRAKAQDDSHWRETLDTILEKFDALRVVQAVLSEADKHDLQQRFVTSLRQEVEKIGSRLTIEGDYVGGDKFEGDKVAGDKIGDNNEMVATGNNIRQTKQENHYHYYSEANKTPELHRRYLQRLRLRCHVLPLEAMGGEGSLGEGVTLDRVYVSLNTTDTVELSAAEREEAQKKGRRLGENERRPLQAIEAATSEKRLVLLGDPGSGKSTFVQQLAAEVAGIALGDKPIMTGWQPDLLPIITLLRDLAPRLSKLVLEGKSSAKRDDLLIETLLDLWRSEFSAMKCADLSDLLEERLDNGLLLLIFDGLDEVPPATRHLVRSALLAIVQRYPQIDRIIVTCRVRSYRNEAELPTFHKQTLAPFTREQIYNFIAGWYQAQFALGRVKDQQSRQEKTLDLQQAAVTPSLRELSENPMLLTTMALIHQQNIRLPPQRVQLYKLAVNTLLKRWQTSKGIEISPRLEQLLNNEVKLQDCVERIGYESLRLQIHAEKTLPKRKPQAERAEDIDGDELGDLGRGDLITLLDDPLYLGDSGLSQDFLNYVDLQAGLLIGRGGVDDRTETAKGEGERKPHSYRFPHRTFQEYLAGCYLVSQRSIERVYEAHAAEGDRWELAALLGGEALLFNRSSRGKLLDLMYYLCANTTPRTKQAWRKLLWSAQLANKVERSWIERDNEHKDGGKKFLRRLTDQLLVAISAKSGLSALDKAIAGRCLSHLGDPRPGVGVKNGLPDIVWSEVILPGDFVMGSTDEEAKWDDEKPQFICTLIKQPYRISRYPVTVAQYRCFIEAKGYEQEKYWTKTGWQWRKENKITGPDTSGGNFELDNHPQVNVSWYEAVAFCKWLAERIGQPVRLPSEAEWERAARHTDGRIYAWGNDFDKNYCNMNETGIGSTSAVGIFPKGNAECGAVDMMGNVWEWCSTEWSANYQDYQQVNRDIIDGEESKKEDDIRRVLRGGAWDDDQGYARCAARVGYVPSDRNWLVGFRLFLPGSESLPSSSSDLS